MPIDYSKYPRDWKTAIVPRILNRANNCCEFCYVHNGAYVHSLAIKINDNGRSKIKRIWISNWSDILRMQYYNTALFGRFVKQVKVVLTVAHLDHDEMDHDVSDDRLAALCQYCHLNYDKQEKSRRAKTETIIQPVLI